MDSNLSVDAGAPLGAKLLPQNKWPKPEFNDLGLSHNRGEKLLAFTIDNVFTKEECETLVKMTEVLIIILSFPCERSSPPSYLYYYNYLSQCNIYICIY
tara:strand:- start:561 stop:857 length:297 start_codon:yes stop_codon:yes gene_type:complete